MGAKPNREKPCQRGRAAVAKVPHRENERASMNEAIQ